MKLKLLPKLCAVAGSLLLVAGFVSYRAGALDWLRTPDPDAPEYTPVEEVSPEAAGTPVDISGNQMFYGSKSGMVVGPEVTLPPVEPTQDVPEETVIFSGSKSLMAVPAGTDK